MRYTDKPDIGRNGLISAAEVGSWADCQESWRLQYGLGLPSQNQKALAAGERLHARKAIAERIAGAAIIVGRILAMLAALLLLLLLWWWR